MKREYANTTHKHTLHIKCIVLGFTKDEAKRALPKDRTEFLRKRLSLTVKHTLFALEDSGLPRTTYACDS
jgi:hypothetical protein